MDEEKKRRALVKQAVMSAERAVGGRVTPNPAQNPSPLRQQVAAGASSRTFSTPGGGSSKSKLDQSPARPRASSAEAGASLRPSAAVAEVKIHSTWLDCHGPDTEDKSTYVDHIRSYATAKDPSKIEAIKFADMNLRKLEYKYLSPSHKADQNFEYHKANYSLINEFFDLISDRAKGSAQQEVLDLFLEAEEELKSSREELKSSRGVVGLKSPPPASRASGTSPRGASPAAKAAIDDFSRQVLTPGSERDNKLKKIYLIKKILELHSGERGRDKIGKITESELQFKFRKLLQLSLIKETMLFLEKNYSRVAVANEGPRNYGDVSIFPALAHTTNAVHIEAKKQMQDRLESFQSGVLKQLETQKGYATKVYEAQIAKSKDGSVPVALQYPYIGDAASKLKITTLKDEVISRFQFEALRKIQRDFAAIPEKREGEPTDHTKIFMITGAGKTHITTHIEDISKKNKYEYKKVDLITSDEEMREIFFGERVVGKKYSIVIDELYYLTEKGGFFEREYERLRGATPKFAKEWPKLTGEFPKDDKITLGKFVESVLLGLRQNGDKITSFGASLNIEHEEERLKRKKDKAVQRHASSPDEDDVLSQSSSMSDGGDDVDFQAAEEDLKIAREKENFILDSISRAQKKWGKAREYKDIVGVVNDNIVAEPQSGGAQAAAEPTLTMLILPDDKIGASIDSQYVTAAGASEREIDYKNEGFFSREFLESLVDGGRGNRAIVFPIIQDAPYETARKTVLYGIARFQGDKFEIQIVYKNSEIKGYTRGRNVISVLGEENYIGGDYDELSKNPDNIVLYRSRAGMFGDKKGSYVTTDKELQAIGRARFTKHTTSKQMADKLTVVYGGDAYNEAQDSQEIAYDPNLESGNLPPYIQEIKSNTINDRLIRMMNYHENKFESEAPDKEYHRKRIFDLRDKLFGGAYRSEQDAFTRKRAQPAAADPRHAASAAAAVRSPGLERPAASASAARPVSPPARPAAAAAASSSLSQRESQIWIYASAKLEHYFESLEILSDKVGQSTSTNQAEKRAILTQVNAQKEEMKRLKGNYQEFMGSLKNDKGEVAPPNDLALKTFFAKVEGDYEQQLAKFKTLNSEENKAKLLAKYPALAPRDAVATPLDKSRSRDASSERQ